MLKGVGNAVQMQRIRQPLTRASQSLRQLTRPTEPVVLSENRGTFNRHTRGVFYAGKPVLALYDRLKRV